jgi:hypothetical protein
LDNAFSWDLLFGLPSFDHTSNLLVVCNDDHDYVMPGENNDITSVSFLH